jgi:hypothetical protein
MFTLFSDMKEPKFVLASETFLQTTTRSDLNYAGFIVDVSNILRGSCGVLERAML